MGPERICPLRWTAQSHARFRLQTTAKSYPSPKSAGYTTATNAVGPDRHADGVTRQIRAIPQAEK